MGHDLIRHHGPPSKASTLLSDYDWEDPLFLGQFEADESFSILPGLGSAVNSHAGLFNISPIGKEGLKTDSAGLDRNQNDPGVGAFTYVHGATARAYKPIKAGGELFLFDGDDFFNDREWGNMPLEKDFQKADTLMSIFTEFSKEIMSNYTDFNPAALDDLWRILGSAVDNDPRTERLAQALPKSSSEVPEASSRGSADYFSPQMERSTSWLKRNGFCADNIEKKQSTVAQAGRGAFASRLIRKGEVISLLPLIHIVKSNLMDLYEVYHRAKDTPGERWTKNIHNVTNKQLLLNYCLGHEKSPVLLFPYAPGSNLVNHNSDSPNSNLQWTKESVSKKINQISLEELSRLRKSILSMELIATRDIHKGEEIFLEMDHIGKVLGINTSLPFKTANRQTRKIMNTRGKRMLKMNPFLLSKIRRHHRVVIYKQHVYGILISMTQWKRVKSMVTT